jgi:hypothetical protein
MRTDRPVVINDDEPDSTDDEDEDEAKATRGSVDPSSAEQDANPYSALLTQDTDPELCKPIIPSSPERWYDVEAGCYVDEEPLLGLELKGQEGSAASTLVHDLERDMLLAFKEQEKSSSATALSSPQSPCCYTKQSSPQIGQEDDQGDTSYCRLDKLGYSSPLREQDHGEEELQEQHPQQQQQEVAVQAMREEEDGDDDDDDDDDNDREQWGEKRQHQDEIEQIRTNVYHSKNSGYSHDTSNEDEDPRPAKRRGFRLRRPRSLTPPNEDSDGSESP